MPQPGQLDFDPSVDYYKALGVSEKSTADEIKKAYRKLAKQYHPDSTGGDKAKESRFKDISNAYDVLGDAKKRKQYDEIRAHGFAGGFPSGARGPGGATYTYAQGAGPGVFDLGDLFGQFFSGNQRGGRVRVERVEFDGDGRRRRDVAEDAEVDDSLDTHSEARVSFDRAILGTVVPVVTGDGSTAQVKIPPGTASGKKLRLRGKGKHTRGGAGDHYVTVQIDVPGDLDDEGKKQLVQLVQHLKKKGAK
jgi:molecular chaperone DnaJ